MIGSDQYINQQNYIDGNKKPSGAYVGQQLLATNGNAWEWSGTTWFIIKINGSLNNSDHLNEVSKGNIQGRVIVHKFGKHEDVQTTYEPCSIGGIYNTPQVSGAVALRVKAGNANDASGGSGARKILLQGLDETGAEVTETLNTNGASSGSAGSITFLRVYRSYITESGTYGSAAGGSHAASIVIETAAAAAWLTVDVTDFPKSQSQVGVYTVPLGKTAYLYSYVLTTDSNKSVDFLLFKRDNILETSAPYSAMRTVREHVGIQGHFDGEFLGGQKFNELTDIGWMVKAASAAVATADFEIELVDN